MNDSLKYNLFGILTVAVLVSMYAFENIYIKVFSGLVILIGLIISAIMIHRSAEMTDKQKRIVWIFIIPVISLITYLYFQIKTIF
jgi:hypothetical protein